MIQRVWQALMWLLLAVAGLAAALALWFYGSVNEQIRQRSEALLQAALPGVEVRVEQARLVEGSGIEIRGLGCQLCENAQQDQPLLALDEVFVYCSTDLPTLLGGKPAVTRVAFRRPTIRLIRRADGTWNFNDLLREFKPPAATAGARWPTITVEGAIVELVDETREPAGLWTLRDGRLRLQPQRYQLTAEAEPVRGWSISGSVRGDYLRELKLSGTFLPEQNRWVGQAEFSGLELGEELLTAWPLPPGVDLEAWPRLRARVAGTMQASFASDRSPGLLFNAQLQLQQGLLDDRRLLRPLRDLEAQLTCTNAGVVLKSLAGRQGDCTFRFNGQIDGYSRSSPWQLAGKVERFLITQSLAGWLPPALQRVWGEYDPAGTVNAKLNLASDGTTISPDLQVECLDLSFAHVKFPYRVVGTTGPIRLRGKLLTFDLKGQAGTQPLFIAGTINDPGPEAAVDVTCGGKDLRLDANLVAALPEEAARVVAKLRPAALFDLESNIRREPGPEQPVQIHVVANVHHGAVQFAEFPYPVNDIHGVIEGRGMSIIADDGRKSQQWWWQFRNLQGRNDSGTIRCDGQLVPHPTAGGNQLSLAFEANTVPLDEELRQALPAEIQEAWLKVRPAGFVNLSIQLENDDHAPARLRVTARPQRASMQPEAFPYRIENLTGLITFESGVLTIQQLQGKHGEVNLSTSGRYWRDELGRWTLELMNLAVDSVRLDPEVGDRAFMEALPKALRNRLDPLVLTGTLGLYGNLTFLGSPRADGLLETRWDLTLDCQRLGLTSPLPLQNIYGKIRLIGTTMADRMDMVGQFDLDSLDYQSYQFTEVAGPLVVDNAQIVFGSIEALQARLDEPRPEDAEGITAKLLGGTVLLDAQVLLTKVPRYHARATLLAADLEKYATEVLPGRQDALSGKVYGQIDLHGMGAGTHNWQGVGWAALRQANVYQLPLMVSLLSLLSLRAPDPNAFSEGDFTFHISGPFVYFDRLDFRGDAISLRGTEGSSLSLEDQTMDLKFYTVMGRDEFRLPFVDQLLGNASQNLLLITLSGPWSEPDARRDLVPAVSDTLRQILRDLQTGRTPTAAGPAQPTTTQPQFWQPR